MFCQAIETISICKMRMKRDVIGSLHEALLADFTTSNLVSLMSQRHHLKQDFDCKMCNAPVH